MNFFRSCLFFLWLSFVFCWSTFAYQRLIIDRLDGKNVHVVEIDMRDGQHFLVTSLAFTGGDTLENLTKKWKGASASINGVFFCPADYSYCNGKTTTISERIYVWNAEDYSTYRPDTGIRGVFWVDQSGTPFLAQNNVGYIKGLAENINKDRIDDFAFGLGNWPVILMSGNDVVAWSEEHMDNKIRWTRLQSFICHTKDAKKIYFGTISSTNMYQMPAFLKKHFGCYNAMNLDAWASTAMTVDNRVIKRSSRRKIMDAFVVIPRDIYEIITNHDLPDPEMTTLPLPYQLSSEDNAIKENILNRIHAELDRRTDERAKKVRRKIIRTFYKLLEHKKVKNDPRVKAIFQEIILEMITVATVH